MNRAGGARDVADPSPPSEKSEQIDRPIRFGIVGLDHWYSAVPLAKALAKHPETEIVAIADRESWRAEQVASGTGAIATNSIDAVIDRDDVDVIASFVSVDRNPEVCVRAARAGRHILSTKPLARSLSDADRIAEAVEEAGVIFIPSESRERATAYAGVLRDLVAGGRLGRITTAAFALDGNVPQSWPGAADAGWWTDPRRTAGGAWIDHAIYHVDLLRWLLDAEVESVSGTLANLVHPEIELEDYGQATMTFTDGTVATMTDTWSAAPGTGRLTMALSGTSGTVSSDTLTSCISVYEQKTDGGAWRHEPLPDASTLVDHLLARLRAEQSPLGSVRDAWNNLAACLAFYDAARLSTPVSPTRRDDHTPTAPGAAAAAEGLVRIDGR